MEKSGAEWQKKYHANNKEYKNMEVDRARNN
jgi:hypothetical protein